MFRSILIIGFFLITCLSLSAQDAQDSLQTEVNLEGDEIVNSEGAIEDIETDTIVDRPNTAALYSAVLPGLGQVYNKKYWKLPIIYGGKGRACQNVPT